MDWFLPPAPLISEIPDTQALEEEIENHQLLGKLSHISCKVKPIQLMSM